jgi:hypothetical protein
MNEKGFMFPVTLCILLLFSAFLMVHFNQYVSEKRLLAEVEQFERNQFYFLQSLKRLEKELQAEETNLSGSYTYERAVVSYHVVEKQVDLFQISLQLTTESQAVLLGVGYYDKKLQKISKWIERN